MIPFSSTTVISSATTTEVEVGDGVATSDGAAIWTLDDDPASGILSSPHSRTTDPAAADGRRRGTGPSDVICEDTEDTAVVLAALISQATTSLIFGGDASGVPPWGTGVE